MIVNSFTDILGKKGYVDTKVYNQHLWNKEVPEAKIKSVKSIHRSGRLTMIVLEGENEGASAKNYIIKE